MSPSTSLKRDRLLQRNAILRRTGFIEAGAAHKGFAGALSLGCAVWAVAHWVNAVTLGIWAICRAENALTHAHMHARKQAHGAPSSA